MVGAAVLLDCATPNLSLLFSSLGKSLAMGGMSASHQRCSQDEDLSKHVVTQHPCHKRPEAPCLTRH